MFPLTVFERRRAPEFGSFGNNVENGKHYLLQDPLLSSTVKRTVSNGPSSPPIKINNKLQSTPFVYKHKMKFNQCWEM